MPLNSTLKQRIITALIMAPIALAGVFLLPEFGFSLFIGAVLLVSAWEWANLGGLAGIARYLYALFCGLLLFAATYLPPLPLLILGLVWWLLALLLVMAYPGSRRVLRHRSLVLLMGLLVLVPAGVAMRELKGFDETNYLILFLFLIIWSADVGAYIMGRAWGRSRLAPAVSPGKSWAGVMGGGLAALVVAALITLWKGYPSLYSLDGLGLLFLVLVLAKVSVLGDLTVSMFKRHRDIKDSSRLLPGHGGFLDRIDSLLSAAPVLALYLLVWGW